MSLMTSEISREMFQMNFMRFQLNQLFVISQFGLSTITHKAMQFVIISVQFCTQGAAHYSHRVLQQRQGLTAAPENWVLLPL